MYDAYGRHKVLDASLQEDTNTSSIGNLNPFRYRGYFYDSVLGLYFLKSRYYDPETCRFISPDIISILDETSSSINGLNLYMYCGDNPVMYVDPSGYFWDYVFDAIFIFIGVYDFIKNPSWSKALWLFLDIGLAILPMIPAISGARHVSKVDDVIDLTKTYGYIDDFADAGGIIRMANEMEFADAGWTLIQSLNRTDDGFTISNAIIGTKIH